MSDRTGAEMTPLKTLADHVDALSEHAYGRRRAADLARITATVDAPARRRRARPILAGLAAAAVAGAIAVPAVTSGGGKAERPSRALDARSVLLAGAERTEHEPAATHGNYWYSQIRDVERARQSGPRKGNPGESANGAPRRGEYYPFHAYVSITWENWEPYRQGGTSRMVDRDIATSFASPADKAAWQRAGSPPLTDMKPFAVDTRANEPYLEFGLKGTKMADLAKLPTTPAGLVNLVREDRARRPKELGKFGARWQMLPYVSDVLGTGVGLINSPAPPKVRAAAYRMLAEQKGIRGIGEARDGLGRPGVALAVRVDVATGHGRLGKMEEHVIIDPGSARILAIESYPIGADGTVARELDHSTVMVTQGWTDRIGVPAG
jgi:hypothetical protein